MRKIHAAIVPMEAIENSLFLFIFTKPCLIQYLVVLEFIYSTTLLSLTFTPFFIVITLFCIASTISML